MRCAIGLLALTLGCGWGSQPPAKGGRGKLSQEGVRPPQATIDRIAPTPTGKKAKRGNAVAVPEELPNVVLVMGCTVRKDQLTPYGGHADATPFLAQIAKAGTIMDDTIAAAPWTRAASTAILTGKHPVNLGMVEPGAGRNNRRVPESVDMLAERMRDLGYYTLGATANPNLIAEYGFAQGHENYQGGLKVNWGKMLEGKDIVRAMTDQVARKRADGDTRPFFMRMMLIEAHTPRHAPRKEFADYAVDGEPDRLSQYRAHLRRLDDALALLHKHLADQGLNGDNTVFVFIADHGEGLNFPRHHGYAHGQYMTSSTTNIAWLMSGAGVAKGHRVVGPTSQVDLLPTLMGVLGHPVDTAAEGLDGTDLSSMVRGETNQSPNERVWSDTWFGGTSRAAVYTNRYQCQDDFGSTKRQNAKDLFTPGCYDRQADPLYETPIDATS